ncbi:MAG: molybdate ABC transporter substrate-binding protein [Actinomycetota bacterium]
MVAALGALAPIGTAHASAGGGHPAAPPSGRITVSAASSLTAAFTAVRTRFERRAPDATITLNFGASSTLATQITGGAPVDVFASADRATMRGLVAGSQVRARPTPFARNRMEIAVKPGNPRTVTGLADLPRVTVGGVVSLCGRAVPCGIYAARALRKARVTIPETRVTRGADATATIGAVARGDADAAVVYASDVAAAGAAVDGVAIPADQNVVAVYPIAPLASSANPRLAAAFIAFVVSPEGRRILARYGFRAP